MTPLWLSLAGGAGATARFVTDGLVRTLLGRRFPWGTLTVNVIGSFVLGSVTGLVAHHHLDIDVKLIIGTGFCGGFTTFSTASFEAVRLIEERRLKTATLYLGANLALTVIAAAAGLAWT